MFKAHSLKTYCHNALTGKSLSLKVTFAIDLTISIVGVLELFFLTIKNLITQNLTTMMKYIIPVVMGVALVGRMVPNSMLLDVATIEK